MNVQNTEAWNVFIERSEQGVSAVPASLAPRLSTPPLERASRLAQERLTAGTGLRQDAPPPLMGSVHRVTPCAGFLARRACAARPPRSGGLRCGPSGFY